MSLGEHIEAIAPVDEAVRERTRRRLDGKTKPRGSLGRLEALACDLAAMWGEPATLPLQKAVVVMAADHGVAEEGVSAYPAEVTGQMLGNFACGGAAINVLARRAGAELVVVDVGVRSPVGGGDRVQRRSIAPGTANLRTGPAMSLEQVERAIAVGLSLAAELAARGCQLVGLGEMGIGNTTAASALTAAFTGAPAAEVVGPGTGIDEDTRRRKIAVVDDALAARPPQPARPLEVLASFGGFEIAGLAGLVIGAASRRIPVLVDGFITTAAAMAAAHIAPACSGYLVASHRSPEPGHRILLRALTLRPLLDLELRLGEGTGAALAMPLVDAAVAIVHEMASFAETGVTDTGR